MAIEFRTSCPGVPHWISMTYHPNWRAEGAAGVFLASPAFMMVVPEQPVVRLRFVRSGGDWLGILATLAGLAACVAMARAGVVTAAEISPALAGRVRRAVTLVLVVALLATGAMLARRVGSQYFAWRGWRAFQASDFRSARREYDRALFFGRGHASSLDVMFYRASSLFRMDDLPAAIPAYEELVALAPESIWAAESQYQIGICRQRLGDRAGAAEAFHRLPSAYQGSRWAQLALDRLREMEAPPANTPAPTPTPTPPSRGPR
jgi:hypothetical protein